MTFPPTSLSKAKGPFNGMRREEAPFECRVDPLSAWKWAVWDSFRTRYEFSTWAHSDISRDLIPVPILDLEVGLRPDRVDVYFICTEAFDEQAMREANPVGDYEFTVSGERHTLYYSCSWEDFFRTPKEHKIFLLHFLCRVQGSLQSWIDKSEGVEYLLVGDRADECAPGLRVPRGRKRIVEFYDTGKDDSRRLVASSPGYLLSDVLFGLDSIGRQWRPSS